MWKAKRDVPVGKKIGRNIYIHKNYLCMLTAEQQEAVKIATESIPSSFGDYEIIKVGLDLDSISFIKCPTFDTLDEPLVGDSVNIPLPGEPKVRRATKTPQIYHHKWMFVSDDYTGFNVEESKCRSEWWRNHPLVTKEDSSRIGYLNYWEELLKRLK